MKNCNRIILTTVLLVCIGMNINAQDETNRDIFSVNADFVSRYVWRGVDFGNAPAIQPSITANIKGFSIGTWGSYSLSSNTGGLEADLFVSYDFDFGIQLGITDYYFPGERLAIITNATDSISDLIAMRSGEYFNYYDNHLLELNVNYTFKRISLSANYMFFGNENDVYFELAYEILPNAQFLLGVGNQAYTVNGNFNVTNIGLNISKELVVSEEFKLNVFGSAIVNPNTEQIHLVFGIGI